jgi:hypothetical protein
LRARTVAGFAPLIAGRQSSERLTALIATLESSAFLGHPSLRWRLPPSTSPSQAGFHRRSYWRGPTWPVVNWLLWWSLLRAGESERAQRLRQASIQQLVTGGFGEYFDPFTGELLGANDQSWTAAVALDWLVAKKLQSVNMDAAQEPPLANGTHYSSCYRTRSPSRCGGWSRQDSHVGLVG